MKRVILKNFRYVAALLVLAAIGLGVGGYILVNQGNRLPWSADPIRMTAVLDNAQAVTPGQGQQVSINGVQIGKIATVDLVDGRAVVGMDIEPDYVDDQVIRRDAQALLRPRTPLKDMYIQILPGSLDQPAAEEDFQVPISRTMSDVDLDEILASLDERTMDYVQLLADGLGDGLEDNGEQLAEVFKRFGPTVKDLARVNKAVSEERTALRGTVNGLARLNRKLAEKPKDLSELVTSAESTFGAFAAEDDNLRATIDELPETLKTATRTLRDVKPLADELGPATSALIPAMRALDDANRRVRPAARANTPVVRDQIRPFVRDARPLVRDLAPAATALGDTFPELDRAGKVLNRFFNMLGFNKDGREAADKPGRDEGYLYWLAWTAHNGANLINVDDANGPLRPIFLTGTCGTLTSLVNDFDPISEFLMGLSPVLAGLCGNPETTSLNAEKSLKLKGYDKAAKKLTDNRKAGEK